MGVWGPGSDENDGAVDAIADATDHFDLDHLQGQALSDARDAAFLTYDFEGAYDFAGLVVHMLHDGFRLPLYMLQFVDEHLEKEDERTRVDETGWYDGGVSRIAAIAKEQALLQVALAHDGQLPPADRDAFASKSVAETMAADANPEEYAAAVAEAKEAMAKEAPLPPPFAWLDDAPTKTLRRAAVVLGRGDAVRGRERADIVRELKAHPRRFQTVHLAPYAADEEARKARKGE